MYNSDRIYYLNSTTAMTGITVLASFVILMFLCSCSKETHWHSCREKFHQYTYEKKYNDAVEVGIEAVQIANDIYGSDSDSVVVALEDLGLLYKKLKKFPEAKDAFKRQYTIAFKIYLPTDIRIATVLNNMALVELLSTNLSAETEKQLIRVDEILCTYELNKSIGSKRIAAMHNLIKYYVYIGQIEKALVVAHKVIELSEQIYGHYELLTLDSYNVLATVYNEMDSSDQAKFIVSNLRLYFKAQGQDPIFRNRIALAEHALATIYLRGNKRDSAVYFALSSLEEFRRFNDTINIVNNRLLLGKVAHLEKNYREADSLYKNVYTTLVQCSDRRWLMIGNVLIRISENAIPLGHYQEALQALDAAQKIYQQYLPVNSPKLKQILKDVAGYRAQVSEKMKPVNRL